ncbi:DMT family transporter [Staphylococcus caledonicus]|uniref:DMT family transporter n=1 Tax=Staphylococcus sp. acrmy TaxID=2929076 RepID=UPI001F55E9B4|nr:EamA family transporter [Staphylococcus sp. acrmy]MCI2947457.1 DMT family transporter [Staphylococcus sp. acrmy]
MNFKKSPKLSFLISIILTTVFMGSSFPTGKYLISLNHAPPFLIGSWRFIIAGILMLLFTLLTKGISEVTPRSNGRLTSGFHLVAIIGLLQTTGTMVFLNLAMAKGLSSSMSSIILFTNPLWLAILAHFLLNDKFNRWKFLSLLLGIIGVILCLGLDKTAFSVGALFALIGSFCWSINTVITKRVPFDQSSWVFTGWQLFIGGMGMFIISMFLHENYNLSQIDTIGWFCFIWLILPASIGSFGLWFYSLKQGGANNASSFLFLVPLFSTIFSMIGLHDHFTVGLLIGGILIILSLTLVNKSMSEKMMS